MKKIIHNLLVLLLTIIILYKFRGNSDEPLLISVTLLIGLISVFIIIKMLITMHAQKERWQFIKTAHDLEKALWGFFSSYQNDGEKYNHLSHLLEYLQQISERKISNIRKEDMAWMKYQNRDLLLQNKKFKI